MASWGVAPVARRACGAVLAGLVTALLVIGPSNPTEAVPAPAIIGATPSLTPQFDTPIGTAGGFTVNVINYSSDYAWSATTDAGVMHTGTPAGTYLPLTVTGLQPGRSATVKVTTEMPGLDAEDAIITGTALTSPAAQNGRLQAAATVTFMGKSVRLTQESATVLRQLVAGVPSWARIRSIHVRVSTPKNPTQTSIALARSRANAITASLRRRGVVATISSSTVEALGQGIASVAVVYTR